MDCTKFLEVILKVAKKEKLKICISSLLLDLRYEPEI